MAAPPNLNWDTFNAEDPECVRQLAGVTKRLEQELDKAKRRGKGPNIRIREFKDSQDPREYDSWVRHCKNVAKIMEFTPEETVGTVLASMTGSAAEITSVLSTDVTTYQNGIEGFWKNLRKLFVSPAHTSVAQAMFASRYQGRNESIRGYHAALNSVWTDAYLEEEEPWHHDDQIPVPNGSNRQDAPGLKSRRLIEQFVTGLLDENIRVKIRDSITYRGAPIADYQEALNRALTLKTNADRAQAERQRGKIPIPFTPQFFDQPAATNRARPAGTTTEEPMEIGAMGVGATGPRQNTGQGRGVMTGSNGKWCSFHRSVTHSTQECKTKDRPGNGPQQGTSADRRMNRGGGNQGTVFRGQCYRCKGHGHSSKYCATPPQAKPGPQQAGQGTQANHRAVNQVVEEDPEHWDEAWGPSNQEEPEN